MNLRKLSPVHHWGLPILAVIFWWVCLIGMLGYWAGKGRPHYSFTSDKLTFIYISDIGATAVQPLFITFTIIQGLFFFLALLSERFLRHKRRLIPNTQKKDRTLSILAIVFGFLGQLGIIFLSIFDTKRHHNVHISMLGVFLVGMLISTGCIASEFSILDKAHREVIQLRISCYFKFLWMLSALGLALGFVISSKLDYQNQAAVCEWTLAFWYGTYLIDLAWDLYPAAKSSKRYVQEKQVESGIARFLNRIPGIHISPSDSPEYAQEALLTQERDETLRDSYNTYQYENTDRSRRDSCNAQSEVTVTSKPDTEMVMLPSTDKAPRKNDNIV